MARVYATLAVSDLAAGKIKACPDCGTCVFDTAAHDKFHAVLLDGRTR